MTDYQMNDLQTPFLVPDDEPSLSLDDTQGARVLALGLVKPMLTSNRFGGNAAPSVDDLIQLAEWVLNGVRPEPRQYPIQQGDVIILGPEIFATEDGRVICWQGENYVIEDEEVHRDDPA